MYTAPRAYVLLIFLLVVMISGCDSPGPLIGPALDVLQTGVGLDQVDPEPILINNCAGPLPLSESHQRSVEISADGGLQLQIGNDKINGAISGHYHEGRTDGLSVTIIAPANHYWKADLEWRYNVQEGVVTPSGARTPYANYHHRVPIQVLIVGQGDYAPCPGASENILPAAASRAGGPSMLPAPLPASKPGQTATANIDGLELYNQPQWAASIAGGAALVVAEGPISVQGKSWVGVTDVSGNQGWCAANLLWPPSARVQGHTITANTDGIELYTRPQRIGSVEGGRHLEIVGDPMFVQGEPWVPVTGWDSKGQQAWCSLRLLKLTK